MTAANRDLFTHSSLTLQTRHRLVKALLKKNVTVRILLFTPPPHLRYSEFEIDLAAGLEESLILAFKPPWNGRDGARPITEEAEREAIEEAEVAPAGEANAVENLPDQRTDMPRGQPSRHQTTFQIKLGSAYYNQGLINPGTDASQHLGQHGDPVIVYLGSEGDQVDSVINRTANRNGSVRIVGNNRQIAEWFQQNFQLGEVVDARVRDPQHILLLPRNNTNS